MPTLLDQLKTMTVVVCDTGDIQSIEHFKPRDATTNPSLITAAAEMPKYQSPSWTARCATPASSWATARPRNRWRRWLLIIWRVEFGKRILQIVPKRVSTEVDARLSYDTDASVEKGREIIAQYESAGISRRAHSDQDCVHLGRHQSRRNSGEGRHPLQPDTDVRAAPGHRLRAKPASR